MNIVAIIVLFLMTGHAGVGSVISQGDPRRNAMLNLATFGSRVVIRFDNEGGPIMKR